MSDFVHRTRVELEADAAKLGYSLVIPGANQLCLDYDEPYQNAWYVPEAWVRVEDHIRTQYGVIEIDTWRSRHGNTHMIVTLQKDLGFLERITLQKDLGFLECITLQAVSGSDPHRELNSLRDLAEDANEDPSVLFRPLETHTPDTVGVIDSHFPEVADDVPF